MAWLDGWNYRKKITIDDTNVDGNLSDFPVYVDITADSDIGGNVSDTTNGYDIRFTDADGETTLKYERAYFNVTTGTATGHYWAKVPNVYASPTGTQNEIYIYYNDGDGSVDGEDAANVWDANFDGVWHLNESGDGSDDEFKDSKGTNHGTGGGAEGSGDSGKTPTQATGKIYKAQDFDGDDDFISITSAITTSGAITVSFWNNVASGDIKNSESFGGEGTDSGDDRCYSLTPWGDSNVYWDYGDVDGDGRISTAYGAYDDKWTYVSLVSAGKGGSFKAIYLDGGVAASDAGNSDGPDGAVTINIGNATTHYHIGLIEEFRISKIARSADWITFEHANMNEGDNELDWQSEETPPSGFIPRIIVIT